MHISDMFGICESSNVGSFDEFRRLIERVRRLDLTVEESIMCAALSLLNGGKVVCFHPYYSKLLSCVFVRNYPPYSITGLSHRA